MFHVTRTLLKHDGGTKFYETVMIIDSQPDYRNVGMLIKRYGSIDKVRGQGMTLVERFSSERHAKDANAKIINEKQSLRAGKGCYIRVEEKTSLHGIFEENAFYLATCAHYEDTKVWTAVDEFFELERGSFQNLSAESVIELKPEPIVVIDRGTTWGSF